MTEQILDWLGAALVCLLFVPFVLGACPWLVDALVRVRWWTRKDRR